MSFHARSYPASIHDRPSIRSAWPANPTVPPGWGQKKEKKPTAQRRPRISLSEALRSLGA